VGLVEVYEVSVPQHLPALAREETYGGSQPVTRLALEGLKVRLRALDKIEHKTDPTPTLMVWLAFEPASLGCSFNPMKVSVRTPEGAVLRPKAYTHYTRLASGGGFTDATERSSVRSTEDRWLLLGEPPNEFNLAFDTVVTSAGIELTLDGMARGGQAVVVPTLSLARRWVRQYRGLGDGAMLSRPPVLE
jgi:hypothetical protein